MARSMRVGSTPVDWYVYKFGSTELRLNSGGEINPALKFKKTKKKRIRKKYVRPAKGKTIIFTAECGRLVLHRYVDKYKLKQRFPSLQKVIYV